MSFGAGNQTLQVFFDILLRRELALGRANWLRAAVRDR